MILFGYSVSLTETVFPIKFAAGLLSHCYRILMNEWLGRLLLFQLL